MENLILLRPTAEYAEQIMESKKEYLAADSSNERDNILSANWRFEKNSKKHICFYRIEDVNALMSEFDVKRLHLVGAEMISGAMRELLLSMTDEEFLYYAEYVYSICERSDMIGMSGHLLDIFEKN